MKPIAPADSLFLVGESREHPMHAGTLQLFRPPADAGPEFVTAVDDAMLGCTELQPSPTTPKVWISGWSAAGAASRICSTCWDTRRRR
jgi:hypothetical protein